jgi:ribokinase
VPTEFDVIVVGSVNVDMVVTVSTLPAPGVTITGGTFERHGGGKSANQAVAAARLGARVGLIAAIGDDAAGSDALAELQSEGVDVSRIVRLMETSTGVALIVVDDQGENQIAVASAANEELDAGMVASALEDITLAADGVCLLGFEVSDGAIEEAARWAYRGGHRVIIDPAPARPLTAALIACEPMLTPNAGEAEAMIGVGSPQDAAIELARSTSSPAVVTLGGQGVVAAEGDIVKALAPYEADVVDTTGAGDAFSGALAANLSESREFAEAVKRSQAAAALSTQAAGARTGMPTQNELRVFLAGGTHD